MPLIASAGSKGTDFVPAPPGPHQAVCVDVVDLGMVTKEWEGRKTTKHMCRLVWEIDEKMDDGRQFIVGQRFTISLHEKATLRKFLESWRGRPFSEEELDGFDLEKLLGANCILNVVHKKTDKATFANVASVTPLLPKMLKIKATGEYKRVQDREDYVPPVPPEDENQDGPLPEPPADYNDDEIPF